MSSNKLLALCATTAAVALTFGVVPAVAQQDQPEARAGGGLEEIVVTARRRGERIQSVPIAITAFSQADVEQKHIQQASDLALLVPSVSANQDSANGNVAYGAFLHIRGLPAAETYFADVPLGNTEPSSANGVQHGSGTGFFYDLDHVEIDKGPQGTLFGKNSVGGNIVLQPKKPTNDFEGYAMVTLGNYGDREFEGAINIPVVPDKLLVRIAGQGQQRDGYVTDVSTGQDLDNRNRASWRVGVTLRPTDDLENYFLYDGYWDNEHSSIAAIPVYLNPGFTFASFPVPGVNAKFGGVVPLTLGNGPALSAFSNPATAGTVYGQLLAANAAGKEATLSFFPNIQQLYNQQLKLGPRAILDYSPAPNLVKDYNYGFTNTTTWDVLDNLTVKNIAAARVFKSYTSTNGFPVGLPVLASTPDSNPAWQDNSAQYTEELQLQGKALNDKLSWIVGGYLEFDHPLGQTPWPVAYLGVANYSNIQVSRRSQAAFAHGTYDLSDYVDGLHFTAGYRYTWDYYSETTTATSDVSDVIRNSAGVANNCANFGADNNCVSSANAHYSSYGWNLALDYQLTPDTLVYVRSGNAYRPGSLNISAPPQYREVKPEHVTDVEIGVKSDWDLGWIHGRTNFDLFHTDYKDIQVNQLVSYKNAQGVIREIALFQNAASAELEGGELEATLLPYEGVEISPHASYLYTHYNKYPTAFNAPEAPPFLDDPKWLVGVTGTYHLPVDASLGDISLSMTYSFTGQQYGAAPGGDVLPIQPSFSNLNVRADWTDFWGYPVDLAFFMTNALDDLHRVSSFPTSNSLGFVSLIYNEPRMFGFSVKYRFGGEREPEAAPAAYVPPPIQAPAPAPQSYLVFFDFDKSDLTPQAKAIVDTAAKNAAASKVTELTVTGHTDTVGSDAYNMRLSRRRAESVAAQLEKDGIPSSEVEIVAKGKRDLLVPTGDGVREPQNRRVQIIYAGGPTS